MAPALTKALFGTEECQSSARLKKNPFTHTPTSFHSCPPLPFFFLSSIKFQSYSSEVPGHHYLSLVPCISPVFQCALLLPLVLHAFCLCLTKTQRGVWSSCPICQSDTVVSIRKKKTSHTHPTPDVFTFISSS